MQLTAASPHLAPSAQIQRLNTDPSQQFGRGMRRGEGEGAPAGAGGPQAPRGGVRAAAAAVGVVHPSGPRVSSAPENFYNLLHGGEVGKAGAGGRGSRGVRGGRGSAGPMNLVRRPTALSSQQQRELMSDTAMDGEVRATYRHRAQRLQVRSWGMRQCEAFFKLCCFLPFLVPAALFEYPHHPAFSQQQKFTP